ncbi:Tyrosinase [Sorochytrium milnesiophthora]
MASAQPSQTKALAVLVALALLAGGLQTANAQCYTRREIRSLSGSERQGMQDAFNAMMSNGQMAQFRDLHSANLNNAHSIGQINPYFLLWHRSFLMSFEEAFVSASGGRLSGLPYYDITTDVGNPNGASIWSSGLLGSLGECVGSPFANWNLGGCIRRNLRSGWGQCNGNVIAMQLQNANRYSDISYALESTCHNAVHNSFDGDMYSMTTSTEDPFFYPFHNGLDHMFARWQANGHGGASDDVDLNRNILGRSVEQLFSYNSGNGCYTYSDTSAPPNPPSPPPPPPQTSAAAPSSPTSSAPSNGAATAAPAPSATSSAGIALPTQPVVNGTQGFDLPDFEPIPASFLEHMGMTADQAEQANEAYRRLLEQLHHMRDSGQKLPSMDDIARAEAAPGSGSGSGGKSDASHAHSSLIVAGAAAAAAWLVSVLAL